MVAEIAQLRVVEQLVPNAFRDRRPSYLLATTGRARMERRRAINGCRKR